MMPTSRRAAALVILALLPAACSLPGSTAKSPSRTASSARTSSPSTSPSQSPSPAPVTGGFGVLVSSLSSSSYTVSLVGIDGRVIASAIANTPGTVTCANAAAGIVPAPVSTSNTRVYFMDSLGVVRYLSPNGDTGQAITLPIGPARRSLFAVSPDDTLMAVVVLDFTASGATTRLYMYQLQSGGSQNLVFSQSGAYTLWPTGWHGMTSLVVAKVPACTQGGGPFCCGPQEFHVVDPATAVRRFIVGGSDCVIVGPPSPAGAVCQTTSGDGQQVDWTGARKSLGPAGSPKSISLSPDGVRLATSNTTSTSITKGVIISDQASTTILNMDVCGWIDNTHVIAGGDAQNQPRVADVISGTIVPVGAQGDCAGRIPGGL